LLLCVDVGIGMSGVPQPVYGFKWHYYPYTFYLHRWYAVCYHLFLKFFAILKYKDPNI
jgi:hypothetical protein